MNIRKIKLNLLIAFDALMKTGSVSLAAKECHVTQAAMSNSLKQLREMFADPLFIRESKGMSPTSKAIMLHAKIRDALASIEQVFMDAQFNPKISKREFHLALSEHGENLILPKLYAYLATHAPFIKIRVMSYTETMQDVERLSSDVDMAIGTPLPVSSQIHSEVLLREAGICVMSKRHPCARQSMTLKRYFSFKHIAVNYNAGSPLSYIDALLKKSNLQRDVALYVPNIRTALELIKTSELVGTFPKTLVEGLGHKNDFVFKKIPFEVSGYKIVLLHHKRWGSDPAHAWLVNVIHTIASQLGRID